MKKSFVIILFLSFLAFQACKDDVAPKVILNGDAYMEHVLNQPFIDPGYAAFDDEDGEITNSVIASALNVDSAGIQTIVYSVTDAEGNAAEALRTVTVYNEMETMQGNWAGEYVFPYPSIDKISYIDSLSSSSTVNMNIIIKNFGGNTEANLEGTVMLSGVPDAPTILFSNQTVGGLVFSAQSVRITNNFTNITFEYTIGTQEGVLVLAKQ